MQVKISQRMAKPNFPADFLATILEANADPSIINLGGGLPNVRSFPIKAMKAAADKVMGKRGVMALQYSNAKGYAPLREFIAESYRQRGIDVDISEIIITNGSQQALDIFSAVMIDPGDKVIVENPSYFAALQVFHLYDSVIVPVNLNEDGIDVAQLEEKIKENSPQFVYIIPNFQNPTGITYSDDVREAAAKVLQKSNAIVLEDNPYEALRFEGRAGQSFASYLGEQCCMLGTFSKTVSPGMRIGWIVCKHKDIYAKMITCKSAVDMHTNMFGQMVMYQYLKDNNFDEHIASTCKLYKHNAEFMLACIEKYFPEGVNVHKPEGGMFMWVTLPEGVRGIDVQAAAIKKDVAVIPGDPFYEYERNVNTIRLNFASFSDEVIDKGIRILGEVISGIVHK